MIPAGLEASIYKRKPPRSCGFLCRPQDSPQEKFAMTIAAAMKIELIVDKGTVTNQGEPTPQRRGVRSRVKIQDRRL